jgi:hypothetical protein
MWKKRPLMGGDKMQAEAEVEAVAEAQAEAGEEEEEEAQVQAEVEAEVACVEGARNSIPPGCKILPVRQTHVDIPYLLHGGNPGSCLSSVSCTRPRKPCYQNDIQKS